MSKQEKGGKICSHPLWMVSYFDFKSANFLFNIEAVSECDKLYAET